MPRPRRRRCSALHRRYGCFRLPFVKGASHVSEHKRKGVSWIARTDPERRTVEFSEAYDRLSPEAKRYIVLHERAHLKTGTEHDDRFYEELKRLIARHGVSWKVAYELESYNCHKSH